MTFLKALGGMLLSLSLAMPAVNAAQTGAPVFNFDIPEQELVISLNNLSNQTETLVLFPYDLVKDLEGHPLRGRYTVQQALDVLLTDTGLEGGISKTGVLTISRSPPETEITTITKRESDSMSPRNPNLFSRVLGFLAAAVSTASLAQDTAAQNDPASIEEIVVTGTASRIVRDGYDSPTPTTVLGVEQLEKLAPATIIEALRELPLMRNVATPETVSQAVAGNRGQSFANLRGLGANRNLVLLNGQRFVPTTNVGTVDISLIPSPLLSRVDVVTGGASAAWGSDAVAGVLNFVLNDSFSGFKADYQTGVTRYGDGRDNKFLLTGGIEFADGRGHLIASGELYDSDGITAVHDERIRGRTPERRFQQTQTTIVNNPAWTPTNGEYRRLLLDNVVSGGHTTGGIIASGPLRLNRFLPSGEVTPVVPEFDAGRLLVVPGDPADQELVFGVSHYAKARAPLERSNYFSRMTYDLTPEMTFAFDVLHSESSSWGYSGPVYTPIGGTITIRNDNAFLHSSVRDLMADAGVSSFTLGRASDDLGPSIITAENRTRRVSASLNGNLTEVWGFDAYLQYGDNREQRDVLDNTIRENYHLAHDAVLHPTTGEIVCRSSIADPGNGCVPINFFGNGSPSAAARDYIYGDSFSTMDLTQLAGGYTMFGDPFTFVGNPVSVTGGLEYREETSDQTVDAMSEASVFVYSNPQAMSGELSVLEGFVETVVPLLVDRPLVENLDLNAGIRATDYSVSGRVNSWKVGLNYSPMEDLRFRATRSRDIRAPNLREFFTSPIQSSTRVDDPILNTQTTAQSLTTSSKALDAEVADTAALGIVYRPQWFAGFSMSVDYYSIEIEDAISRLSSQQTVDRCYEGVVALCELIERDPGTNEIRFVTLPFLNLEIEKTSGFDLEFGYQADLEDFFPTLTGALSLRAMGNYVKEFVRVDGDIETDTAGSLSDGQPEWAWKYVGRYDVGNFSTTLEANRIGEGKYNSAWNDLDFDANNVDAFTLFNWGADYTFETTYGDFTAYVAVQNLFDEDPPRQFRAVTNSTYSIIGRSYRGGIRVRF